jgi:hypothetical protein
MGVDEMSIREISVMVRAENRASGIFRMVAYDALHLGYAFGLLDTSAGRAVSAFMSVMHILNTLKVLTSAQTVANTAESASLAGKTVAYGTASAGAVAMAGATGVYTGSAVVATTATHGLSLALHSLLGPIGLFIGLATAVAAVCWATNQAADAQKNYNEQLEKMATSPRYQSVLREREMLSRRGLEVP